MAVRAYATRLDAVLRSLDGRPEVGTDPLLAAMAAETQTALEELRTTEEELHAQAAQLADAEGALERERRRYQDLFDFAPDAYFITDTLGVIQEANHAVSALVGYARGYVRDKPLSALVHPDDVAALVARLMGLRAAGGERVQQFDLRLRPRRTGPPVQVRARVAPIRDAGGALVGLRWLVRDVSETTQMAERLRTLEAAHAQELRTRTMELEAVVRMQAAQIAACEGARTELRRVAAEARRALQHGAEARALLAHVLESLDAAAGR
jgi:PAS domain S-box-containing protein